MTEVVEGFDAKTVKQLPNFFPQSEAGLHVLAKITQKISSGEIQLWE